MSESKPQEVIDMISSLSLTPSQISFAQKIGGLTFRPVSNNRLVCNQAPDLGRVSSRQADSLRGQVYPKNGGSKVRKARIHETKGTYSNNYRTTTYAFCPSPSCGQHYSNVYVGQRVDCSCGKRFKVAS